MTISNTTFSRLSLSHLCLGLVALSLVALSLGACALTAPTPADKSSQTIPIPALAPQETHPVTPAPAPKGPPPLIMMDGAVTLAQPAPVEPVDIETLDSPAY